MSKENTTLSIDGEVKKNFKIECTRNSNEMSEVVELMMKDYIHASISMHNDRKNG